jgi:hypothetical protein
MKSLRENFPLRIESRKGRLRVPQDVSPGGSLCQRAIPQGRPKVTQDMVP